MWEANSVKVFLGMLRIPCNGQCIGDTLVEGEGVNIHTGQNL